MSNSFCNAYIHFIKSINFIFRNNNKKITIGLVNYIILNEKQYSKDKNLRISNITQDINPTLPYIIHSGILRFVTGFKEGRIAYTEENEEKKGCCGEEDHKNLVLTERAFEKIQFELGTYEVVLFMKGTAKNPSCGFSKQALDILKALKVDTIRTVNVLEDQELRDGVKVYSKYPFIPQLYVRGKFIGGVEKMSQMFHDGTLEKIIREE